MQYSAIIIARENGFSCNLMTNACNVT